MRRACWNRKAPGPPRDGWGSRGKRRPWDGWRGTPAPTPHRSGRARAPQALASALARAEVDGAVLVWCSPLPWLRPVLLTTACKVVVFLGSRTLQRPFSPALGSGAGCEPVPEVPPAQRPVPATARSALVAWPCRSAGSAGAPGCKGARWVRAAAVIRVRVKHQATLNT